MIKLNTIKKTYLLFGLSLLSLILHNAFYGIFKKEEPVFFILTFVFALLFILSIIYCLVTYVRKGEPKDLWKLGWLGLFGLIGLMSKSGSGFLGFFGFFGFFAAKEWNQG